MLEGFGIDIFHVRNAGMDEWRW